MRDLEKLRIVILGGGPAGLAVARLLGRRGIASTVLERDSGPEARTQGGSLELTEGRGLRAIAEMGLSAEFASVARPEAQQGRIVDTEGAIRVELTAESMGTPRPEIDRKQLRALLLGSLPAGVVRWGSRVTGIERQAGGRQAVRFEGPDGRVEALRADLVVACDGIWSRARVHVTGETPQYVGITYLHGDIENPHPDSYASRLVRQGMAVVVGEGRSLGLQRHADGTIRVYFMLQKPEADLPARGSVAIDRDQQLRELHATYAGWAPELTGILDAVTTPFEWWPIYTLPERQVWTEHHGLTLAGDAAHVMPPFTGQGVNFALLDAVELVAALTSERHATLDAAIIAYERAMLDRMEPEIALANSDDEKMMSGVDAVLAANGTVQAFSATEAERSPTT